MHSDGFLRKPGSHDIPADHDQMVEGCGSEICFLKNI